MTLRCGCILEARLNKGTQKPKVTTEGSGGRTSLRCTKVSMQPRCWESTQHAWIDAQADEGLPRAVTSGQKRLRISFSFVPLRTLGIVFRWLGTVVGSATTLRGQVYR